MSLDDVVVEIEPFIPEVGVIFVTNAGVQGPPGPQGEPGEGSGSSGPFTPNTGWIAILKFGGLEVTRMCHYYGPYTMDESKSFGHTGLVGENDSLEITVYNFDNLHSINFYPLVVSITKLDPVTPLKGQYLASAPTLVPSYTGSGTERNLIFPDTVTSDSALLNLTDQDIPKFLEAGLYCVTVAINYISP